MSQYANGTSRLFSCAKSFPAAPTKATESTSRASPVCQKKFSTAPRKFSPTSKIQTAQPHRQSEVRHEQRKLCRNRRSRSWICFRLCPPTFAFVAAKLERRGE